ncbi:hypothetical protein QYM36_009576, partial [Artemia franciscana]
MDKDSSPMNDTTGITDSWKQYIHKKLNCQISPKPAVIRNLTISPLESSPSLRSEVEAALRSLVLKKLPGPEVLQAKLLKVSTEVVADFHNRIATANWHKEYFIRTWCFVTLIPMHKNGNLPKTCKKQGYKSHLRGILELLAKRDSEDLIVPTYAILSAYEVPSVPDLIFSHLSSKLTRMEKVLNAVASRAEVYDNNFPPLPQLTEPNVLATIGVSKIPALLDNPIKRKELLDKVTGHEY